ncbi:MAG: DUF1646 family protein [Candidatus Omnitrophica bacterium]|nr:DUF1646 family protein [Candidatus Omnitrophota bacterium]
MVIVGLFIILALVLFAPFSVKIIEEELEVFLFIMGCIAVTVTSQWSIPLVKEALVEPIKITLAVFLAGLVFFVLKKFIKNKVNKIADKIGIKLFSFLLIISLGFLSSIITAIIAALILVEIVTFLILDRKNEILLVVLACFAIGLGAALTPIGEPLSTITVSKLKGAPYYAGFLFLFQHLKFIIIPGILLFGISGFILMPKKRQNKYGLKEDKEEDVQDILIRTVKVYFFVVALIFLGQGFKPIVDTYIVRMPYQGLYWFNVVSAVLDNATLAAAEISPSLSLVQLKSILLGLLIAGGMLIPGNIPNIIAAGKLKIKSSEWAKIGVPLGLLVMFICFFLL